MKSAAKDAKIAENIPDVGEHTYGSTEKIILVIAVDIMLLFLAEKVNKKKLLYFICVKSKK